MLRKDLRSMILSLVLGDGCLHYIKNKGKLYGGLTIDHGIKQADYQKWKAELLSDILKRNVRVRTGHKGQSVQVSVCMKRFKAWRKFCYPDGKKDIGKILKFINNPYFAITVWLMDDGYVHPNNKKNSACFRLYTCETPVESQQTIIDWFKENLEVDLKIRFQKKGNKRYPFLVFKVADSLKIWKEIREFILGFRSMRYKFRHIEHVYQLRMTQAQSSES